MSWIEYKITLKPFSPFNEIVVALLAEENFESFAEQDENVFAYIRIEIIITENVDKILSNIDCENSHTTQEIEEQNWNKIWEEQFEPIEVEKFCRIRAPFHQLKPGFIDIVIEPKMSFGTGHHSTTFMMLKAMHDYRDRIKDSKLLDMGCGTAILAIAAEKIGAQNIIAIDNDQWAYENSIENTAKNNCSLIEVKLGDASTINGQNFDIVLANINRNILSKDLVFYKEVLNKNGLVFLSGFFTTDISQILEVTNQLNLRLISEYSNESWACLVLES
jgi:ribosomal protein L11 methyltransferase